VNGTAEAIGISYLVVVILGAFVAAGVASSTRSRRPVHPEVLAERERTWLFIVIALLVAILGATMWFIPYGRSAAASHQVVNGTAQQFVWLFNPPRARVGEQVEFRLTSKDVNHGFGLYDPSGTFVDQVQVVPGKTQKLFHTFHHPGTYRVVCLEFCGRGHASMIGQFQVVR
jgi:cytochrome c oxidase subunit II